MRFLMALSGGVLAAGILGYAFGSSPLTLQDEQPAAGTGSTDTAADPSTAQTLTPNTVPAARNEDSTPNLPSAAAPRAVEELPATSDPFGRAPTPSQQELPQEKPATSEDRRSDPLSGAGLRSDLPAATSDDLLPSPDPQTGIVNDFAQAPSSSTALHIIRLQYSSAIEVTTVISQMFHDRKLNITADERTNSVILRCSTEDLREITALVEQLDSASEGRDVHIGSAQRRSLHEQRFEQQIREILAGVRAANSDREPSQSGSGIQNPNVETLVRRLQEVLGDSFDERQRRQLAEIEELTVRLQKLAQQVREREARREQIIRQRLSQLLSEGSSDSASSAVSRTESPDAVRQPDLSTHAVSAPQLNAAQKPESISSTGSLITFSTDSAMTTATLLRGRIQDRISALHQAEHNVRYAQDQQQILALRKLIEESHRNLKQDARDAATQRTLVEIEAGAAVQELQLERQSLERLSQLVEKGAISSSELHPAQRTVVQLQAKSDRLKTLMDLFRDIEQEVNAAIGVRSAPEPEGSTPVSDGGIDIITREN